LTAAHVDVDVGAGPQPRRVVVTGAGAVTSLGRDVEEIWDAVVAGRSGVAAIQQFDSRAFPVRIGSEVDVDALRADGRVDLPSASRSTQFGVWALEQAWRDARLDGAALDRDRAGVCIGASTFPVVEDNLVDPVRMLDGDHYDFDYYIDLCRRRPELLAQRDLGSIATVLSQRKGLRYASMTIQTACASAAQAIGESFAMIRAGEADLMVTGGADSMMTVLCVAGFTLVGALSPGGDDPRKASRPFDLKRDGFVLGEGAGLVILEGLDHARARGAPILAEMIGYGSSSDGYRFTDVHPQGRGAIASMRAALASAGVAPAQVGYINAHGTATLQNDLVETRAIKEVFGPGAGRVAVSSTKSQLAHLVCAAGGIEMVLTALALRDQVLPPTINLEHPDPLCDLDYVPNHSRRASFEVGMSNSFGFGGQNGTIMLRRWNAS
jgi:3-oxoacyl-[acyl-carrier-protein] synthase II